MEGIALSNYGLAAPGDYETLAELDKDIFKKESKKGKGAKKPKMGREFDADEIG